MSKVAGINVDDLVAGLNDLNFDPNAPIDPWDDGMKFMLLVPRDRIEYVKSIKSYEIFAQELEKHVQNASSAKKKRAILQQLDGHLPRLRSFAAAANKASKEAPQVVPAIWGLTLSNIQLVLKKSKDLQSMVTGLISLVEALPDTTVDRPYAENARLTKTLAHAYQSYTGYLSTSMMTLYSKTKLFGLFLSKSSLKWDLQTTLGQLQWHRKEFNEAAAAAPQASSNKEFEQAAAAVQAS